MLCDSSLNNNSNLYSIRTAVSKKMISSYIFQEESACSKLMIEQQLDDNYNSFIDISNIIHDTKRKLKSYSLYDIDSNRKKNNRNRDYDSSYDNLRAMKRSKTCAGINSCYLFNLIFTLY